MKMSMRFLCVFLVIALLFAYTAYADGEIKTKHGSGTVRTECGRKTAYCKRNKGYDNAFVHGGFKKRENFHG